MENFGEYIGYIVFLVLFVLPRILKLFKKTGSSGPSPVPPTLEEMLEGRTIGVKDREEKEDTAYIEEQLENLGRRANSLLLGTEEVERRVQSRGGPVVRLKPVIASNLKSPLSRIISDIQGLKTRTHRTEREILQLEGALSRLEKGLSIATTMVDQRLHPATSELLSTLDVAAKDCLSPYMVHARRLEIPYPTHFAVTIAAEAGLDAANALPFVAPLVVDQRTADLPRSWVQLVSDISLDVYHATPGLARRLAMDLGTMPSPLSLAHYGSTRSMMQGLVGAWLPRIFADVGAAIELGPAIVSGLNANVGAGLDEQNAVLATVGQSEEMPPAHIRMFAALRTVARMGFTEQSKAAWETWRRRLNYPKEIGVRDREGGEGSVSTAMALDIVARVVDYLFGEPLSAFGGYPLSNIPYLRCDDACMARMTAVASHLVKGRPTNAPGRILIGGALLAVEKSPTSERRIGDAALKSLRGKGVEVDVERPKATGAPATLSEVVRSRELAMRAIAVGAAVAPRRNVLGRSGYRK